MNLLDLARGPLLQGALAIFLVGVLWRLVGVLLLARRVDHTVPRSTRTVQGGLRTIITRFWPRPPFIAPLRMQLVNGYVFHIGLAIVMLGFGPHIKFIQEVTGLSWPALPNPISVWAGAITLASLGVALLRRLTLPVLRFISTWEDYLAWTLTTLPVLTGLLAYAHLGARYETLLGLHLLSVDLLLIWFPFGTLMHAILFIPSRYAIGAAFERKGVQA